MDFVIALLGDKNGRNHFINDIDCESIELSSGVRKLIYVINKYWEIVLYDMDKNFEDVYLNECDGILHFCSEGKLRTWKSLPVIHCYEEKNTTETVLEMVKIIEDIHSCPMFNKELTICLTGDSNYVYNTVHSYDNKPKRISCYVFRVDVDDIFSRSVIIYGLYFPIGKYLDDCDGIVYFCSKRSTRYKSLVPVVYHSIESNFDPVERLILTIIGY
uniref:Uncharacterized protein n=1 Tax=Pithovirus LCPAC401 TaxID=2506595 RepID=A0A481Z9N9_9VIRU|nr:MAG: uncharacterized protein LCPAC401_02460 [Pithovirus LCPAC401]